MTDMTTIQTAARIHADNIKNFQAVADAMNDEISAIHEKYEQRLRILAIECRKSHEDTLKYVAESRSQFIKPKAVIVENIKFGFIKGKITVNYDSDANLAKRIKKIFPEKYNLLVETKERVIKDALKTLSNDELTTLCIQINQGEDEAFVKLMKSEAQQLIDSLLTDKEV